MTSAGLAVLVLLLSLPFAHSGVIRRRTPQTTKALMESDMAIFFVDGSVVLNTQRRLRSRRGFRKGMTTHYGSSRKQRRFLSRNFHDQLDGEDGDSSLD